MGKYKLYGESLLRLRNGLFAGNALPPMEPRRICKTGWEYPRLDMKDKKCKKQTTLLFAREERINRTGAPCQKRYLQKRTINRVREDVSMFGLGI